MRADGMRRGIREAVEGRSCDVWAAKRKRRTAMAARSKGPQISEAQGGIVPIVTSERAFKGRFCSLGGGPPRTGVCQKAPEAMENRPEFGGDAHSPAAHERRVPYPADVACDCNALFEAML